MHAITERIFDKDNGYTDYTTTVQVNNVAPTVTAPAAQSALLGAAAQFQLGTFSDPGVYDGLWSIDVNWGDGSVDTKFTVPSEGTIPVQSHAYTGAGPFTMTIKVTDNYGATGSATAPVNVQTSLVVLDPTASGALSVSGNGIITVPGTVIVDSSSAQALSASGNAHLTAAQFLVHGKTSVSGNATLQGALTTGVTEPNPLAALSYNPTMPCANTAAIAGRRPLEPTAPLAARARLQRPGRALVGRRAGAG